MLLLCLLLAVQDAAAPRHDLAAYLALARQYRTAPAPAVEAVRGWTAGEVAAAQRALRSLEKQLRPRATRAGELDLRLVETAALLHVEAGLRALQEPNEAEGVAQMAFGDALVRWTADVAAKRQKSQPDEAGLDPAQWRLSPRLDPSTLHATLAAATLAVGFPEIADKHAEEARRLTPTDAQTLLTAGCAQEGLAHLRDLEGATNDARRLRERAERTYGDVLALDASIDEARLRLGRLRAEAGRLIEAEPLLERVEREAKDDRQRYLALLFLARAAERRKDPHGAGELYSRALEVRPDGTAARVGLALQLERQAGPAAARTVVLEALARARRLDSPPDPWTSYLFGGVDTASAGLKQMWDKVLAP
jgi:tetratricopeptide (TPR) repeat protein